MNKISIVAFVGAVISFFLKQVWLSVILIIVGVAFLEFKKQSKSKKHTEKVKVQPIIVQREYVGPKSIYPEKLEIEVGKPGPTGLSLKADKLGKSLGKILKSLFK
ncbi:MAG: hypothetical protein QW097_01775 [archaeon]